MVTPQHDGNGTGSANLAYRPADSLVAVLLVGGGDFGVAVVDDGEHLEGVHSQGHVGPVRASAGVSQPDGPGPESGAGAVGNFFVDGRADAGHVDPRQVPGVQGARGPR